jgi:hypothetical protein
MGIKQFQIMQLLINLIKLVEYTQASCLASDMNISICKL